MDNLDLAKDFFETILGPLHNIPPVPLSALEFIEAMWPLNDVFRSRIHQIRAIPYRPKLESQADKAIELFAAQPQVGTWSKQPTGVWRVLFERHLQLQVVASANVVAGNRKFTSIPDGLPEDQRLPGLMLLWLHSMELPMPIENRAETELPEAFDPASFQLH